MKRFGLKAAIAAIVNYSPRGRIYALAPAVALFGFAVTASVIAPRGPATDPVDVAAAARAMLDRGRPLFAELPRPEPDQKLGSFKLTYYFMAEQEGGKRSVQLYQRKGCKRISKVSRKDAKQLALQGGGKLEDGRILIYAGHCKCSGAPCYSVAEESHEWGTGVQDRPPALGEQAPQAVHLAHPGELLRGRRPRQPRRLRRDQPCADRAR